MELNEDSTYWSAAGDKVNEHIRRWNVAAVKTILSHIESIRGLKQDRVGNAECREMMEYHIH